MENLSVPVACYFLSNKTVAAVAMSTVVLCLLFSAVILFLTYNDERNIYDHRWLEYSVYDIDVHIKVIRKSMMDVEQSGRLSTDHCLFVYSFENTFQLFGVNRLHCIFFMLTKCFYN